MSNQKATAPKRGRGRPPKIKEEELPEEEPAHQIVNPRFAIPDRMHQIHQNTSNLQQHESMNINTEIDEDLEKIIQQIHDSEIAMAMDESFATYASNTHIDMNGATSMVQSDVQDDDMENILQQIREKETKDIDSKYARELSEADNPPPEFASANAFTDEFADASDIDDVLEQIRQMEANEKLQKTGHSYAKPLAIDRLIAQQDAEDEEIRRNISKSLKRKEWDDERARQDREYTESLIQDQEKERIRAELQRGKELEKQLEESAKEQQSKMQSSASDDIEVDEKPIPKSKEELRMARMQFFGKISKS